jgi:hypothetical protein
MPAMVIARMVAEADKKSAPEFRVEDADRMVPFPTAIYHSELVFAWRLAQSQMTIHDTRFKEPLDHAPISEDDGDSPSDLRRK